MLDRGRLDGWTLLWEGLGLVMLAVAWLAPIVDAAAWTALYVGGLLMGIGLGRIASERRPRLEPRVEAELSPENAPAEARVRVRNLGPPARFAAAARVVEVQDGTENRVFLQSIRVWWEGVARPEAEFDAGAHRFLRVARSRRLDSESTDGPERWFELVVGDSEDRFLWHSQNPDGQVRITIEVSITSDKAREPAVGHFVITSLQYGGLSIEEAEHR